MNSKLTFLIVSMITALSALAQYPTNGLVGYYPLNSNAFDLSGNERNPKETNAILVPDRFGNPDAAYRFNNNAGHRIVFSLNEYPEFKVPAHTIAYWMKLDPNIPAGQFPTSVSIAGRTDGRVNIQSQNGFFRIENVGYRINEFITHQSGALQVNDYADNWVHIAITYDNTISNWRIYINGVGQVGLSYDANNTPGDLVYPGLGDSLMVFGTGPDFNNIRTLRGELDDVFIYNRPLSQAEIMQLMNYSTTDIPPSAPQITQQPQGAVICENSNITFNISAFSFETETYQWRKDGVPLSNNSTYSGVNTSSLTVSNASDAESGVYDCIVTNTTASITSNEALLNVVTTTNFDVYNNLVSYLPIKGSNYTTPLLGTYTYTLPAQAFNQPALVSDRFGNTASTVQYFGSGARINISPSYNQTQGTISLWYKHESSGNNNVRSILGSTLQTVNYLFIQNNELGIINPATYKTGFIFNEGEWYHLALKINGNTYSAYVNGLKVGEHTAPTVSVNTFPINKIGNGNDNNISIQPSSLDDFRIYNEALTDDEIANLANMPHFEEFLIDGSLKDARAAQLHFNILLLQIVA